MAEFVAPQFQYPDMMRSYLQGQMSANQSAMAPGALALQGQEVQSGQLNLAQLRQMMQFKQQAMNEYFSGAQPTQQGGAVGGASGGTQNGPQAAVSQPQSPLDAIGNPSRLNRDEQMDRLQAIMGGKSLLEVDKNAAAAQDQARTSAVAQAKLAMETNTPGNPMPIFKNLAGMTPDQAAATLQNNPQLMGQWAVFAKAHGVDPWDKRKIPFVAAQEYNQRGAIAGLSVPVPEQIENRNLGQNQVGQFDATTGKKIGDVTARQEPTFTMVDKWDPATGQMTKVPVQSGGAGMQGVGPTGKVTGVGGQVASRFPATAATLGFNAGFKAPTDPELKAAMFGSEMRSGMNTLNKLEAQGINLSPAARTAFLSAATSEDTGSLHLLLSQEALAHGITAKDQTYMAALMPMLQAAGHDQSGARLSTSQVRQNIESMLPIDVKNKESMDQIRQNRQGFYVGLLGQAGSSTQLPQYKNTLGADLKQAQSNASRPEGAPAAAIAHLKAHPELADQFKAKYGYLPGG